MDSLNIKELKRDAKKVIGSLKKSGEHTITTKDIYILIPESYTSGSLAVITDVVDTIAIYAIVDGNNYGVINAPVRVTLTPSNIALVDIDGVVYYKLMYNEGDTISESNKIVKNSESLFPIFNYFYLRGKVPWYLTYNDVSKLLIDSDKYTGTNIGTNPIVSEVITSIIARDKKDSSLYYRLSNMDGVVFKGMTNQFHVFTNTTAKLVGSYFSDGVVTALTEKSEEVSNIEEIFRS